MAHQVLCFLCCVQAVLIEKKDGKQRGQKYNIMSENEEKKKIKMRKNK